MILHFVPIIRLDSPNPCLRPPSLISFLPCSWTCEKVILSTLYLSTVLIPLSRSPFLPHYRLPPLLPSIFHLFTYEMSSFPLLSDLASSLPPPPPLSHLHHPLLKLPSFRPSTQEILSLAIVFIPPPSCPPFLPYPLSYPPSFPLPSVVRLCLLQKTARKNIVNDLKPMTVINRKKASSIFRTFKLRL